jgi:isopentenyldiphosphate isomerase
VTPASEHDPYTNPDELFDVLDALGRPTGRTKRRADVHRDGDWHRAFHCWVLDESEPGRPHVLYQRRGAHKDTWPSKLDVTVGGHYAHGETLRDVVREVEEEIGRPVALGDLIHLGTRAAVGGMEDGVNDHEIQDVFLWRSDAPLAAYRPQPVEVTALERMALDDALALFDGERERASSRVLLPTGEQREGWVVAEDFVPTLDRYFYRVAVALDLAAKGYARLVV